MNKEQYKPETHVAEHVHTDNGGRLAIGRYFRFVRRYGVLRRCTGDQHIWGKRRPNNGVQPTPLRCARGAAEPDRWVAHHNLP